jgi:predicted NUDIX family phosphoesterase
MNDDRPWQKSARRKNTQGDPLRDNNNNKQMMVVLIDENKRIAIIERTSSGCHLSLDGRFESGTDSFVQDL